jgi:transposase
MPAPFASAVVLNDTERSDLESLVRANSTPQALAFRARLVLRAAESDQPSNWQIGIEFACSRDTASKWRRRYLQQRLPGLQDAPRSGRPRAFSP